MHGESLKIRLSFRSGRLPVSAYSDRRTRPSSPTPLSPLTAFPDDYSPHMSNARRNRRGRGRQPAHPASRTLDLGKLGRDEELGIHEGAPAQLRSGGLAAFFRNLFSRSDDIRTRNRKQSRPSHHQQSRYSSANPPANIASSGRLGRHAAASSLGSLQSYATSTIRATPGPIPSCLSQGSTSEVGMKKRVIPKRDLDSQPVFSKQVRDNTLLSNKPNRFAYPNFALAEFGGRNTWHSDVFTLLHNAIRWEIMDLYTILSSIQQRWTSLQMLDIWELSEYWEVFEVFVAQYFEIEDQIIFPFMLNVAGENADLKQYHKVVKFNRDKLENCLHDIGTTLELFNTSPSGQVLPTVYAQLSGYLPQLLDYMQDQEKVLPNVFSAHCDPEDRALINRAAANFIVRAANGRDGIAILTRWIEDSMVLQIWKNENLSARAQNSHKRWIASLESTHVDIAARFRRRMRTMPKNDPQNNVRPNDDTAPKLTDRSDPNTKSASTSFNTVVRML